MSRDPFLDEIESETGAAVAPTPNVAPHRAWVSRVTQQQQPGIDVRDLSAAEARRLPASTVLHLQRSLGNQAVVRLLCGRSPRVAALQRCRTCAGSCQCGDPSQEIHIAAAPQRGVIQRLRWPWEDEEKRGGEFGGGGAGGSWDDDGAVSERSMSIAPGEPDVCVAPDEPNMSVAPGEPDVYVAPDEPNMSVAPEEPDVCVAPDESNACYPGDDVELAADPIPCQKLPASYEFSSFDDALNELKSRLAPGDKTKLSWNTKDAERGPCCIDSGYEVGNHHQVYNNPKGRKKYAVGAIGMCPCKTGDTRTKRYAVLNPG